MRKPSSPLRRVLAVTLSLLILPWQQPALALAETPVGPVVLGLDVGRARDPLTALDRKLEALVAVIKSDEVKTPDPTATLPADLTKIKADYKAAQDKYVEVEKVAPEENKAGLKPLLEPSTGQVLADALVETDLGGIRKDLTALLVQKSLLSRAPGEIKDAAGWAAIEKAAPDFRAGLRPLSLRVEKARNQAPYAVKEVEEAYRPLADGLNATFQNLRGEASKLDIDGLLAAKPATLSGDAAGALMAEVAKAIGPEKAALLKPQLAAVNTKLAGYLRSGNQGDLTNALAEIDRLYDAANIKDKDRRAELYDRIGNAAQARAQAMPATAKSADAASVLTSNGVKKETDLQSMRRMDEMRLDLSGGAAKPDAGASALAAWWTSGRAAAGPAWEALLKQLPGASGASDPAGYARDYALRVLAPSLTADASPEELAQRLGAAAGSWLERGKTLRAAAAEESRQAAAAEEARRAAAADASRVARDRATRTAKEIGSQAGAMDFAAPASVKEKWTTLGPGRFESWAGGLGGRASSLAFEGSPEDKSGAAADWDAAGTAVAAALTAQYEAISSEITVVIRDTKEADGEKGVEEAARYLRAVEALFGAGASRDANGSWDRLEKFWTERGAALAPAAAPAHERAARLVALLKALVAAQAPPTGLSKDLRNKMVGADGSIMPFGEAISAVQAAKLDKARRMGAFLENLSATLKSGGTEAEMAAKLKAAFDGQKDLVGQGDDLATLANGLLAPPPAGDAPALAAFTQRRKTLQAAVEMMSAESQGVDNSAVSLTRGFAQYNAFLYARLQDVAADSADGRALQEEPLKSLAAEFRRAYENSQGELSDVGGQSGQFALARKARAIVEKLPSLTAKRDAAQAQTEYLAALDRVGPERGKQLEEERQKTASALALFDGIMERAAKIRAQSERIKALDDQVTNGQATLAQLNAAKDVLRGLYDGSGKSDTFAALCESAGVNASPDADFAGAKKALTAQLAAKNGEIAAYRKARGVLETALTGMVSQDGDGRAVTLDQVRLRSQRMGEWNLVREAREVMGTLAVYQTDDAARARLETDRRELRDVTLRRLYYGDYQPAATVKLREMAGRGELDAAQMVEAVSGIVDPRMVNRAFVERAKLLSAKKPGQLTSHDKEVLGAWTMYKAMLLEMAGQEEAGAGSSAAWAELLSDRDPAHWSDEALDDRKREFLTKVFETTPAKWRERLAYLATPEGKASEMAKAYDAQAAKWKAAGNAPRAELYRRGAALTDPAATLAALSAAVAEMKRRDPKWNGFTVLDDAWAKSLLAQTDPKAAVAAFADKIADGQRERLFDTTFRQDKDFTDKLVGRRLAEYVAETKGVPQDVKAVASAFTRKEALEVAWEGLGENDRKTGEMLFGARAQLQSEVMRAWERNKLPEVRLTGGGHDPDFSAFTNDKRITELRRLSKDLGADYYDAATGTRKPANEGTFTGVMMGRNDDGVRTLTARSENGREVVNHVALMNEEGKPAYRVTRTVTDAPGGKPRLVEASTYTSENGPALLAKDRTELTRTIVEKDRTVTLNFTDHSQFVANNDGTARSYGLADGNDARVANRAVTELRKDATTGEYVVEARRYLRAVVDDAGKPTGKFSAAVYERPEGGGLWSVHTGAVGAVDSLRPKAGAKPESMYYTPPAGTLSPERIQSAAAATAKRVEALAPMGDKGQRITGLTSAFIAAQLTDSARLGVPGRADLSLSFDVASKTMQSSYTVYGYDAKGKRIEERRSVQAVHKELISEHDGKFMGIQFTDAQKLTGLVIFDGGQMKGIYVEEKGAVRYMGAEIERTRRSDDGALGFAGAVVFGEKHYEQVGFGNGAFKLAKVDVSPPPTIANGGYGMFGILTLAPVADKMAEWTEQAALYYGASPKAAKIWGAVVGAGFDIGLGIVTMGPGVVKLIQAAGKYGKVLKIGLDVYFAVEGVKGAYESIHAMREAKDDAQFASALRGLIGSAVNVGMIAYMHAQTRPEAGRSREAGKEVEVPKGAPEPPPVEKGLKDFKEPTPESKVPDTKAPDTKVPDTKVPDTKVPDTKVPDTKVPDTKIPDTKVPDTRAPEIPAGEAPRPPAAPGGEMMRPPMRAEAPRVDPGGMADKLTSGTRSSAGGGDIAAGGTKAGANSAAGEAAPASRGAGTAEVAKAPAPAGETAKVSAPEATKVPAAAPESAKPAPKIETAQRAAPAEPVKAADARSGAEHNGGMAEAAQRIAPSPAAEPMAGAKAGGMDAALPRGGEGPMIEPARAAKAPGEATVDPAVLEAAREGADEAPRPARPEARREAAREATRETSRETAPETVAEIPNEAPREAARAQAREGVREAASVEPETSKPAAENARKLVEPSAQDAELLHQAEAESLRPDPAPAARPAAKASGGVFAAAEAKAFGGLDVVGRAFEGLAAKLHESNRPGGRAAVAAEGPAPSRAAKAVRAIVELPQKMISNMMAEIGDHLRRPANTAADAGEARFANFGARPEFIKLAGAVEPGAEVRVKVGVNPESGALAFGEKPATTVEVRAKARADGTFELLDVGKPEGAALSPRAAEHLEWVADRGLGMDGSYKGVVGAALERMGRKAPSLIEDAGFRDAAAKLEGGAGPLEAGFDPRTGKLTFGETPAGAVKVVLEIRAGEGGPEVGGWAVKSEYSRLEAAAAREIGDRLESSYRVGKLQAGFDSVVDSRAGRAALAKAFDTVTGGGTIEANYDPKSGRLRAGSSDTGINLKLGFGHDGNGALRLRAVDMPGRSGPLPVALEHNARLFAERRVIEPVRPWFHRAETAKQLDARLAKSRELAERRVKSEAVLRERALNELVGNAEKELAAARRVAGLDAPVHTELAGIAERVVVAREAAAQARADIEIAKKEMLELSPQTRAALPKMLRANRELARAQAESLAARKAAELSDDAARPAAIERVQRALTEELKAGDALAAAQRLGSTDRGMDMLVRRENARRRLESATAAEKAETAELDRVMTGERQAGRDTRLSLAAGEFEGALKARDQGLDQLEYRRQGYAKAVGADGSNINRLRLRLELGLADESLIGRRNVGQAAGQQLCGLATAADMYAAKTGKPVEGAMEFAEQAVRAKFADPAAADTFIENAASRGMNPAEIDFVMRAVAEAAGLKAVKLGAADSPFGRLAAGDTVGVVLSHADGGGHMVNLSNWRMAKNPVSGRLEAWVDVADPNTRVRSGPDASGRSVYEAKTYSMRADELVPQIRTRVDAETPGSAAYVFESAPGAPRAPPAERVELARRMGGEEGIGAGVPVAGTPKPAGFEVGPGKVLDATYLPENVFSREIMEVAREHGLVYELGAATLGRMKPGVEHNYVIVENLNHTIEMTVGRLTAGNVQEVGVKHAALGDGRAVIFSGGVKIDPATGRPVLDFNSGTYSEIGRDPRWAPTPENARALAAHAEAILKTKVDVVDHFTGQKLLPAAEGIGAAPESPRSIVRTGATRGEGWTIDGKPAERLSGGGFKEVLIHPTEPTLVIKIFDQAGARDTAGSLSEKRLEMRNLEPLLAIGRAPRVIENGAVELQTPSTKGKMNAGYIVQERVNGRSLGDMLKDTDPAVRSQAIREARALVEDLIAARIKLEDRVNMHENISVGVSGKGTAVKAWVLDAGEATRVAAPGMMDKIMGRPDPLRAYYDSVMSDLTRLARKSEPVLAKGRSEGIGAAPDMGRYERYFSAEEIMAAHKAPETGGAYHDWQHTVKVADMAGEFAQRRGLSPADAKFVSEVALLHDFDARRTPGMPARVPDTLKDLRDDFAGRRSLNGEAGRSVLKERFGWTETQLKMAEAMIQRTEFPFGAKHPSPAYAEKGPLELYENMLRDPSLTPEQKAFVLREGALLSEYADKSSWYATEDFAGAYKTVQGLASEINRVTGKNAMSVENLGTNGFLKVIGEPVSFAHDYALAEKLGVQLKLMNRAEAFKLLPERYGKTFEANLEGFRAFDEAVKAKDADPFARGRAAAEVARNPRPSGEGIGSARQAPADSFITETVQVIENMIAFPFKTKAAAPAPAVVAPAPPAASAYAELPASFRTSIEGYYRNTMIQASPRALAKAKATSGADPFWWFDHGPNHGRNVVENASALIKTAQERGIIEPRSGARAGTMDLMTRVNAGMHDIWMQDLTQTGRPLHPARAAREAFSHALETPANDILAMKVDGNRTLADALVQEYGIAPADVPRVMREMMSMSYGHSKSAVPLEVLDSPSRMRQAMKDVVRAQEAGMETPYESHYEKGAYDRVAYDWLETNPKLSADMIDAVRILRPADAMRWRGPNDSRSSNGSGIGVAVIDGKVTTFMRMADDATGKTYMVRFQSPISMGEANTRYTAVNERGELTLGLDKGDFGSPANNRVMAEGSAHVILDVAQDWVGSFRGVQGKPIVVELPVERSPEFKKMVQDGLHEALAELKKKGKDTRLAEMVVHDVVFVEPVPGMTKAAAPRAPPAELARYENGQSFDPVGRGGPDFLRQINENGVNVGHLDPARAFEGARVVTLAPGEQLIAKGSGGEFVYVLMDGGLKAVLGQGYAGHPLPAGVPVGEMAVISGNARSADVVATQASRVMAIPKATYMAEWTKAFYSHDTILGRLKDDFAAAPAKSEAAVTQPVFAPEREGIGAGFFGVFGGSSKSPAPIERIPWPVERGGPEPAALNLGAVKLDGPLKNLEAAHTNVVAVEVNGKKAVLKLDAKPNEARVLAAMAEVKLPDNVAVPRLIGDAEVDVMAVHRLMGNAPNVDYGAIKRSAGEGRHMIAVERLADDYVSMMSVTNGSAKLKAPIAAADWQGLLTAVKEFARRDMAFGDFGNETNIRVRQVPDGKGGVRTEFALIDVGQGTLKGNMDAINSDYIQLKGQQGLESRLIAKGLLEGRGRLPDPSKAAAARNQVPQARDFAAEMSAAMKAGGKPSLRIRAEGRRFANIQEAAAFLNAPEGMHLLAKTSEGLAGDTVRVEIGGQDWYLKRVSKKLNDNADDGLRALSGEDRAANEIGMREIVRRLFSSSFDVAPEAVSIRHGGEIFVLTKGAAAAPDPARVGKMTLNQRVDWSILRLVFRAEDTNRGNILFNESAKPTLIDFEKVIAAPLDPVAFARGANDEIYAKGFRGVSLAGNDMAPYHARAEQLRARFADPAFVSELSAILQRSGWSAERTATYLKAVEVNLKNFETNVQAYFNEVTKTSLHGRESIGAGNEHAPALQLGLLAAAHFYEPYTWSTSGGSRSRGIVGCHEEHIFRAALKDIGGKTTEEFPVPGFPGMTFVRYQLQEMQNGVLQPGMRPRTYPKTIVDAKLWPKERLAELGGSLYAEAMKKPDFTPGQKEYKVTRDGVEFILFVTDGQLTSFGAEAWDGKPAYVPPSRQMVPTARTPIKRDP